MCNIDRADCSTGLKDSGVVSFKLFAMLGSFGVTICDDRCSIADIQIQGTCLFPKLKSMIHKSFCTGLHRFKTVPICLNH